MRVYKIKHVNTLVFCFDNIGKMYILNGKILSILDHFDQKKFPERDIRRQVKKISFENAILSIDDPKIVVTLYRLKCSDEL